MKRDMGQSRSSLYHSEAWEIALAKYLYDTEGRFNYLKDRILGKRFTVKDSGATHRIINHWSEMGIIDDSSRKNEQGWRKFSMVDLIWIHVLTQLRRFGMSLDNLKRAFQSTFHPYGESDKNYPMFEVAILHCLQRRPISTIVFADGWCEYMFKQEYDLNVGMGRLNEKAYLMVNLNQCVSAVFPKLNTPKYPLMLELSGIEVDVIAKLRKGDLNELHLKLRDGQVQSLKKIYKGSNDYQGLIDKLEFGEYTVKRQNGKTVFVEVVESQRTNP